MNSRLFNSRIFNTSSRGLRGFVRGLYGGFRPRFPQANNGGLNLRTIAKSNLFVGFLGASVSLIGYNAIKDGSNIVQSEAVEGNGPKLLVEDVVLVDSSINPFPTSVNSPKDGRTKYTLIGYGVRKVTFLNFKVYGLGIYVAEEDAKKVPEVFNSKYLSEVFIDKHQPGLSHAENLRLALKDSETSEVLINSLLDANVRFVVRIVPLRDTDFNHLRDGFVKSCVRNKLVKSQAPEKLDVGVDEIRAIFKKYRSKCPKNHVFLVETDKAGKTTFLYENYGKNPEQGNLKEKIELGTVEEEIISKALLLNYFAGSKPISEDARKTSIESFVRLV